ncbi:MAG TPA: ATP-binding cassette domain-containing protein [Thermoplasmatales archaeon]|nr:ATP-binding cassette domain-containing protein [Thermoplasmatales archaeon]
MSIIETENLTRKFNGLVAVDNVNFEVEEGEIFGFLGPNGAGKTTTIKMLITLLRPTSGTAKVVGFDIIKERNRVRECIGVVFQEPALDTELTGKENLDFHARMYGLSRAEREKRIVDVLQLVDLTDKADVLVKNYSGGMKRRLEIARGLMHYPKVLFLDEPTLGLDTQTRNAIWSYIKRLNKEEGTTIFLTTHYMEEADYLSDRAAIIDHGKLLVVDKPEELKNKVGKDLINLKCSNIDSLKKILEKEEWVENIKIVDSSLFLSVRHGEEKIPNIIEIAQSTNIKITSIELHKPTLDDVFLYYTGRRIREQEAEGFVPPGFRRR